MKFAKYLSAGRQSWLAGKKWLTADPRRKWWVGGAVIVLLLLWWWLARTSASLLNQYLTVERRDLAQVVSVTGRTVAVNFVNLSFDRTGKVAATYASVGNRVGAGQVLAILDQGELLAQLEQARAGIAAAQAKLGDAKQGTRPEELLVTKAKLDNAKAALDSARQNLLDKIKDAFIKTDNAVHNYGDKFFNNPASDTPSPNFSITDAGDQIDLAYKRVQMGNDLKLWSVKLAGVVVSTTDLSALAKTAGGYLGDANNFLDLLAELVNQLTQPAGTIDTYKSYVATARSEVSTAIINLSAAEEQYAAAVTAHEVAKRQYELDMAGSTANTISAQEAAVEQAKGNYNLVAAQLAKTRLISPLAGIVTKFDLKAGETAITGAVIASVIAPGNFEIEANVSEVDIGQVKINDPVSLTLDAFPGETFTGRVIYIDPAETIVDGVVNYKAKTVFNKPDERLKSGLTVNLDIETEVKKDTLALAQVGILENNQGSFVEKMIGGQSVQIPIKTGLRSPDGYVEILAGLKEDDQVLNVGLKK